MIELLGHKQSVIGVPVTVPASQAAAYNAIKLAIYNKKASLVTFVNPHSVYIARKKPEFYGALLGFDYILCDGYGMSFAASVLTGDVVERVSFDYTSIASNFFSWCEAEKIPLRLVGGESGVTDKFANRLLLKHPELIVLGCYSGFGNDLGRAVSDASKDNYSAVIVGMGAFLQERFLLDLKAGGWNGIGLTCGGFFDQYIESDKYYPAIIDRLNLRFAYRLYKEPKRLYKRYFFEYAPFFFGFLKSLFPFVKSERD